MSQEELLNLKKMLLRKRADEMMLPSHREEIRIEPAADTIDQLQASVARELAVRRLNRQSRVVRDIDEALDRMARNEFGICLDCEDPISMKRLHAVPWAARCVRCQEIADREAAEHSDEFILSEAA